MQTSRNFAQASQRSPHASAVRRGPGPMYAPPTAGQPQNHPAQVSHQQVQEQLRRAEAKGRQNRKPTDRHIPDELSSVCVGDGVERYRELRNVERRLDTVMMQKRLDIAENLASSMKREGTLRIWISNTAEGQPWQVMDEGSSGLGDDGTFDFADSNQATYRVKIEGRLLEEPEDQDEEEQKDDDAMEQDGVPTQKKPVAQPTQRTKLSHFFKAINIEFDRAPALQPDGYSSIEWKKPVPANPAVASSDAESSFDCLEFERKGDEEMSVTINLVREDHPERYKLSKPLAELLDTEEEDRAGVVAGIWEYVRAMGLQEDEENRRIICDEQLRAVFGLETLFFPYVPELINNHLTPVPPIQLAYTIRMDRAYISPPATPDADSPVPIPSAPTIYDLRVSLPSPLKSQMQTVHKSPSHLKGLKAITTLDDDIALLVQKIHAENAKRKFFNSLAADPANFIKRWVSSQQRDLEVLLAEAGRGGGDEGYAGEEFRRGGEKSVWAGTQARESVGLWLARQKAH